MYYVAVLQSRASSTSHGSGADTRPCCSQFLLCHNTRHRQLDSENNATSTAHRLERVIDSTAAQAYACTATTRCVPAGQRGDVHGAHAGAAPLHTCG